MAIFHEGCEPWRHAVVQPAGDETGAVPERWRPAIASIVDRLVAKDYAGLAQTNRRPTNSNSKSEGPWSNGHEISSQIGSRLRSGVGTNL